MKIPPFLIEFPESEDTLALYYALQDSGMPCTIIRHDRDPKLIKVTPDSIGSKPFACHVAKITGFVKGWNACYYREALLPDKSLQPNPGCIVP